MAQLDIAQLLNQWEETYKKGLLTFWILLRLHQCPAYAYEMKEAIAELSQNTIVADEKSIYRALKRFAEAGLVKSETQPSEVGPPRRYFALTPAGRKLLSLFIGRNILLFQSPAVADAIRQAAPAQD
jgi:PadR family transcriptional regulator PadR